MGVQTSLSKCYLTSKQKRIWKRQSTERTACIAKELGVSRQAVHKAVVVANLKILAALEETAKISRIKVEGVDPVKGILKGYSVHFRTKAFVTFSPKNGVQVWYKQQGDCENCEQLQTCRKNLLAEARYRNVRLPKNSATLLPYTLAKTVFSQLVRDWRERYE